MATVKPLQVRNAGNGASDASSQYKRVSQKDHILLRPDTYIGSTEQHQEEMLVHDGQRFVHRKIAFVPGLFKIFDEILVNAADNKQRDAKMDCIKVNIDAANNTISVYNTGKGIPVQMHTKEKIYIPELIFGNLLTGANFNDSDKKVVGGRNGYGAKLCNIFSTKFTVETCDTERGLRYSQTFEQNMASKGEPKITPTQDGDRDFTRVTFSPELARFNMETLEDDTVQLLTRRVYDIAGSSSGVKVYLNGKRIPINNFKSYVETVTTDLGIATPIIYEKINDRWEVGMTISQDAFQQMSFVNSIATTKGGTHVNYIADQLVAKLDKVVKRKNKNAPIKSHQIKQHMWLFINCLVENPSFDSQTKENMTRKAKDFGSTAELSEKFHKDVSKSGIVDNILHFAKLKSDAQMLKSHKGTKKSKLTGIPKLDDANDAGTRNSKYCTLILTEGDSAKALAVSGLGVVGRDRYGVFPLRGKLLNVREATHKQIVENAEIKAVTQIMGLKHGVEYTDVTQLRYGRLMIMTDQDQDGSHIKGLLINFIHHFWPSLLKVDDFLVEFVTPIVKCTKGKKEQCFFTLPQYEAWAEEMGSLKGWRVKYYKGLGTSTPAEAKEYFSSMDEHQKRFKYECEEDFECIEMAFSKKHIEARKDWLSSFKPGTFLDHSVEEIPYRDFINKELILFSMADNVRSIPSVMDGLKPGQRKVLYSCFKRNLKEEIKVAQLAGYVAEHSSYHHGENSLAGTIVGMAQDFVGSNNINLLQPIGQFGTRLAGGKDAASTRYIFTSLSTLARKIFVESDDDLLDYLTDDGQTIEPEFYAPIIPMVLVNGSDGIGTGWSSSVPNYNPRELAANIMHLLNNEPMEELQPWFKGFEGDVEKLKDDKFAIKGRLTKLSDTEIEISELPIRSWTQPYKEMLEIMSTEGKKDEPALITEFTQHHTDTTVRFVVTMTAQQMAAAEAKGLEKFFKIDTTLSTTNMVLFDAENRIKKYNTVHEIVQDFYAIRIRLYQKRKSLLADRLQEAYERLDNRVRFIKAIISGSLVISNRKRDAILRDLVTQGFKAFPKKTARGKADEEAAEAAATDESAGDEPGVHDYDYLLNMPLWSLTMEKVNKLENERLTTEADLSTLLAKTPEDLWREDLTGFLVNLDEVEEAERRIAEGVPTKPKSKKTKAARKKITMMDSDDDADFMADDDDEWAPAPKKRSAPAAAAAAAKAKPAVKRTLTTGAASVSEKPQAPAQAATLVAAARQPATKHALSPDTSPVAAASKEPSRGRRAAAKKVTKYLDVASSDDEDEDDILDAIDKPFSLRAEAIETSDDEQEAFTAPAGGQRAPAGNMRKAAKLAVLNDDSESESEDLVASASLAVDKENLGGAAATAAVPAAKTKKAAAAPKKDKAPKKAPVAKKAAAKKAAPVKKTKAAPAKKAPAKKAPAKKPAAAADESGSDDEDFITSEVVEPAPAVVSRGRRAAATRVKYTFDEDEEEEDAVPTFDDADDDDAFSAADDDDESDFEL